MQSSSDVVHPSGGFQQAEPRSGILDCVAMAGRLPDVVGAAAAKETSRQSWCCFCQGYLDEGHRFHCAPCCGCNVLFCNECIDEHDAEALPRHQFAMPCAQVLAVALRVPPPFQSCALGRQPCNCVDAQITPPDARSAILPLLSSCASRRGGGCAHHCRINVGNISDSRGMRRRSALLVAMEQHHSGSAARNRSI